MWDECNCAVVWAFFGIASLWDWNENWPFPVLRPLLNFPNLAGILSAPLGQHQLLGLEIAQLEKTYNPKVKFVKLSSGHRTGKGQFSFQSQREAMPKNAQTTTQFCSSHTLMFKILQARLQQYVNHELPDVQAGFRKGRGTRDQIANIHWIIEKAREFQKTIYFCFIDYARAFDCVDHNKLWKILKEMEVPDRLTYLLRNLYTGQEATVRTGRRILVPNRERSSSRLYIVTLLIWLLCRVHHEKYP